MSEQKKMNKDIYEKEIANNPNSSWKSNVVLLRKAIQHIDDKDETLWKEVIGLLPSECPEQNKEAKLVGLKSIIGFRSYINRRLDGLEALQETGKFDATKEWERFRKENNEKLGYTTDGFDYSLSDTTLKMVWKENDNSFGSYEELEVFPEDLEYAFKDGEVKPTYKYINGVDHFYTKLIWNVVSGVQSTFNSYKVSGLYYSAADVLGSKIERGEPDFKVLRDSLEENYVDMLKSAAKEAKKAKEA